MRLRKFVPVLSTVYFITVKKLHTVKLEIHILYLGIQI